MIVGVKSLILAYIWLVLPKTYYFIDLNMKIFLVT